ncbi:hypothetical protein H6P81_016960 [Aristolochia fimbriata]|uniref:Uncharacterized protein n=1 Tax=Aristolochia fimbriata TaxID=158543 RepID=A0AAV7DZX3_ARIFI|nr:hypothetical protein H6P81_016960 [Aristolochia fimbriata]
MAAQEQLKHLLSAQRFKSTEAELIEHIKSAVMPFHRIDPSITIFRVPETLRMINPRAYEVRAKDFSIIGPGRNDSTFRPVIWPEPHDLVHLHSILSRNRVMCFEDYVMAMNHLKDEIRRCHLVDIEMDVGRLIWTVTHGCFIVDLLLSFHERRLPTVDRLCTSLLHMIWVDMLLVENQIPFFVLQRIFDMAVVDKSGVPPLVDIALHFFEQFVVLNKNHSLMEVHHLLHQVYTHLLPNTNTSKPKSNSFVKLTCNRLKSLILPGNLSQQLPVSNNKPTPLRPFLIEPIPTATKLQEAGIQFRMKKQRGFSDITFKKGVLEIPCIWIDNNTEALLRNLVAWEQCYPTAGSYFTNYAIFMDYIVNSTEDAEILSQNGIVQGGNRELVASVYRNISNNVIYNGEEDNSLPHLCKELNEYYRNKFNKWRAKLMSDYFSNPWSIISLVAGFLVIVLTFTQSFYAVYAYARPPKQS